MLSCWHVRPRAHRGAIVLCVGNREGQGIARGLKGVDGRPDLADREGAFGNPTADSLRTSVTHATSRALVVLYLPPTVERQNVERLLDATSRTVTTHCGGRESARRIVP
jgi:DNA/RNA-binding domain of Phe-tRNA-synthetase-like protein